MLKFIASASLAAILTTSASFAQSNYPVKIYPDDHGPLAIDTLYAIEVHCAQGPVPFPQTTLPGPLPNTSMKISHAVVVSTANVNGPAAIASLPVSAVAVAVPYSVDTASASANQHTSFGSCDANYLIEGPASLYLTAIYSEASTTNPGTIADAFHSFVSVVTSLAPVGGRAPRGGRRQDDSRRRRRAATAYKTVSGPLSQRRQKLPANPTPVRRQPVGCDSVQHDDGHGQAAYERRLR